MDDGKRVAVVERGATVRAGDFTLRLLDAQPQSGGNAARGTYAIDFEAQNDADAPRTFQADAELVAGRKTVPFLPSSRSQETGEFPVGAAEPKSVNGAVPVTYQLFFAGERLGTAPAAVIQSLPGGRADQPERAAFLLRPGTTPAPAAAPRPLRRAASKAPGTPVRLPSARAVMPPGWERADQGLERFRDPKAKGRELHLSVWVRRGRTGAAGFVALRAIRTRGAGRVLDANPQAFFLDFQKGYDETLRGPDSWSELRPGSDLGGRPAGALFGVQQETRKDVALVRMLATARGDTSYVIVASGPLSAARRLERVVAQTRRSWSWR
jgi:hypothetical protein